MYNNFILFNLKYKTATLKMKHNCKENNRMSVLDCPLTPGKYLQLNDYPTMAVLLVAYNDICVEADFI